MLKFTKKPDPFTYGGEEPFACQHCAGMGYQDYPLNKLPCPIPGHAEKYERNVADINRLMESLKRPYTPAEGNCPYCLAAGEPVGVGCRHWTGNGWSRDRK
jgi:hypothetical protein